jgi:hypothetical protein
VRKPLLRKGFGVVLNLSEPVSFANGYQDGYRMIMHRRALLSSKASDARRWEACAR